LHRADWSQIEASFQAGMGAPVSSRWELSLTSPIGGVEKL
jgi:hypothetical protein